MFENNRPVWDLTNYIKNWHLDNQEGVSNNKKLDISYPKNRMSGAENLFSNTIKGGFFRRSFYNIIDMFRIRSDDFDEGTLIAQNDNDLENSIEDLNRAVGGVYDNLPFILMSTDILETSQKYQHSLQELKVSSSLFAMAQGVEELLTKMNQDGRIQSMQNKLLTIMRFSKKTENSNKAKTIININDRYIKAIQLKTKNKAVSVWGKWINKARTITTRDRKSTHV